MKFAMLEHARTLLAAVPSLVVGMAACVPPVRSRPYAGGPQIGEIVATGRGGGLAESDIHVQLQFPARFLMLTGVSSVGNAYNGTQLPTANMFIGVHFRPLGIQYTTAAAGNLVTNQTLPFFQLGGKFVGSWLKFAEGQEFKEFWVDCDGAAAAAQLNFIYSNGVEFVRGIDGQVTT